MQTAIITIFCYIDDFLKSIKYKDHIQCNMTSSEVMLMGIVAWRFFSGNIEQARVFLSDYKYISNVLSKSRLNRRLHSIPDKVWYAMFPYLSPATNKGFIVDSFPVFVTQ